MNISFIVCQLLGLILVSTFSNTLVETSSIEDASNIAKWSIGSYIFGVNTTIKFHIDIVAPVVPGVYDTIFFLTGFDGFAPSFAYSGFLKELALQTNSIIIAFDRLKFIKLPTQEEALFELSLNWAVDNLQTFFNSSKTPSVIKGKVYPNTGPNGFTLLSHSSAAHPVVLYLNKTCGLMKKLILMNPVDGYDPFGIVKIFVTNPPNQLPFTIPTLVIANGLDPVPVIHNFISCAPSNLSDTRFYKSLPGPTWYLNFTDYGHADILDEWVQKIGADFICTTCGAKNKDVLCDFKTYVQNLVKAIDCFIKAVNDRNEIYLSALNDPKSSSLFNSTIKIESMNKSNGYNILNTGAFCFHS